MNAVLKDATDATEASSVKIDSYPASEKIYVQGSRPDIQVPMRKITLSDTPVHFGAVEKNGPLYVYDTSGVYTDPNGEIDFKKFFDLMKDYHGTIVNEIWMGYANGFQGFKIATQKINKYLKR